MLIPSNAIVGRDGDLFATSTITSTNANDITRVVASEIDVSRGRPLGIGKLGAGCTGK